jgi:short-subunit dehydrogenase
MSINVYGMVFWTKLCIEKFMKRREADPNARSLITWTSGFCTIAPTHILAAYNASKHFIDFLCEGLAMEYSDLNIHFSAW